ncbi:uncharacterized protein J4E84_007349 [Alternaria hordeiaustralica]|uniref:uncharacterized protein n=1 Tax=Alternaria hordeiaustralica TaxID=1187925 RepID=UPI0020C42C73|nr:uncharacterized protein J4E84_007349 [Alternaria hordeiaustralica]KAI4681754.1 hypothetical protein J4E84_007349 [Alternaria hordeiaustralica]
MAADRVYVADSKAVTHRLPIKDIFDRLPHRNKLYAHHLGKAAWSGARIILRQTSSESEPIFDLIISLYNACEGKWEKLVGEGVISEDDLASFFGYAGLFLYNLGNFYGEGGQKFVPGLSREGLEKLVRYTTDEHSLVHTLVEGMIGAPPYRTGYPSDTTVSNYYPGERITRDEITAIAKSLEKHGIEPENTRVRKTANGGEPIYELLQASSEMDMSQSMSEGFVAGTNIRIVRGDHATEMAAICAHLEDALDWVENPRQTQMLNYYIESFRTGSLSAYRESQKVWVKDISPSIDHILGFVESYRDPHGHRAEWEGVVCVADPDETRKMNAFVENAAKFSALLPWATEENKGKGPFEKNLLDIPDFAIIHALTVCCPYVWEASNLPNYNDIREEYGSKNTLITNRMSANRKSGGASKYLLPEDTELYKENMHTVRFVATVIHELLGHGTGKLLSETEPGKFNFDATHPPQSPLTGKTIESWYLPGQTYSSKFEDIAQTVEECRAILMSAYLVDNKEILEIFGYNDKSTLTADDLIYISYLHLGIEGIRSLEHYNPGDKAWSQAHSQGYFAIFKHLLLEGNGVLTVQWDAKTSHLSVKADRSKILSDGKPALGRMMCRLHVWRCTADAKACREFYEPLTSVEGEYAEWRSVVISTPEPRWKFVQANTFLMDGEVTVKEYEESDKGIIQSWVERQI